MEFVYGNNQFPPFMIYAHINLLDLFRIYHKQYSFFSHSGKENGERMRQDQGRPCRPVVLLCPHAVCRGSISFVCAGKQDFSHTVTAGISPF
jgi:hypothetical protein